MTQNGNQMDAARDLITKKIETCAQADPDKIKQPGLVDKVWKHHQRQSNTHRLPCRVSLAEGESGQSYCAEQNGGDKRTSAGK